jgi:hypothetical protein
MIVQLVAFAVAQRIVTGCTRVRCVASATNSVIDGPTTTSNVCVPLVPPDVVTETFLVPSAAPAAVVKSAVREVELDTLTLLTVTPAPLLR